MNERTVSLLQAGGYDWHMLNDTNGLKEAYAEVVRLVSDIAKTLPIYVEAPDWYLQ
ncbi:hypothetical protein FACS1894105_01590 [Clostridia bacterium]|nr:hypothetical protein FACS1894105_01400 [Clostridia bacterium]GHU34570.1 hypothetical protein FACS1894105_01590 [Clostridia bacterium]